MKVALHLEDGSRYVGTLIGYPRSVSGELVFQTGMCGYVESLTDSSYARQLLTLTYPLVGNYGVGDPKRVSEDSNLPTDGFESARIWPSALIVDRICPNGDESHWQAVQSLSNWLKEEQVPGITGIDTRLLTKKIREKGTLKAKLVIEGDEPSKLKFVDINQDNLVEMVSSKNVAHYGNGPLKVLAVDCGMKYNQIRCLTQVGCRVTVVPFNHPIDMEYTDYDGIFLSNGPGDPAMCDELVQRLRRIMEAERIVPIFGICLGHQLLARAAGAKTRKLPYGNRGVNQPCTHVDTGRCFITAQNHGFAVDAATLTDGWRPLFINENDETNEGIVHGTRPFFGVQFHPEHCAGPMDMELLFGIFSDAMNKAKTGEHFNIPQLITNTLAYDTVYNIPHQHKVLILGSGGLSIGQAGEFDYSGAQAIKALREKNIKTVLINPNVATVQTSKNFADRVYFLPVTKDYVTDVIKKERPSGILCTFGGQTALNCAIDLFKDKILEHYQVTVLGTSITAIMNTEDRERFNDEIIKIGERVAPSQAATTIEGAIEAADRIGYPVLVRAAYALGGLGSGFAKCREELEVIARQALAHSNQVLIDKSLQGWKEVEYEVIRDAYDNCVTVCNMENVDPLGIHTGESVVVAPSQTLTNDEYYRLRRTAIKVIRHFGVIGECNIQYALNPERTEYYIIEVNARLSRSSALASKATGYPLAYCAAKLALGDSLRELRNSVTGKTTACFEPSLDYCVVKIPRWDLSKFARVNNRIGSSMKSVGEVMGIGRSFEEAFQKAFRMVNEQFEGFSPFVFKRSTNDDDFINPTDKRMMALSRALYQGEYDVEGLYKLTRIDRWFIHRMANIVEMYKKLEKYSSATLPDTLLREAKQLGFSDAQVAKCIDSTETGVRDLRRQCGIFPFVKQIDTVAAEWPAITNYLYLTYNGAEHDLDFESLRDCNSLSTNRSVIVLGSGVYRIGSSVEFDACCVGCVQELKRQKYNTIMINCNPETVSTDYDICDKLYFEEISLETVSYIYELENPHGVILAFGGQSANNIALSLQKSDVSIRVFGTKPNFIDEAEDRFKFSRALDVLGISQPYWRNATTVAEALNFAMDDKLRYPCLVRPSYVLSGAAMNVAHNSADLENFLKQAASVAKDKPVVVSKFFTDAKEIDVDVVAMAGHVLAMAISEHVENAGIHSGDATLVTPPQDLNAETIQKINSIVHRIAERFKVTGPFNMQLIAKNNDLYVIECNLRVSRSFPFVSKTLDYDFVALATRAIMYTGKPKDFDYVKMREGSKKVGVKVPQFSFSRLAGADVVMGVEMVSTGEVGCFGASRHEAYLKGLLSTGFALPQKGIFLSFGGVHVKQEMLPSVQILHDLNYKLYASKGTADFYKKNKIAITAIDWPFDEGLNQSMCSTEKMGASNRTITDFMSNRDIDFMINLPLYSSGSYRVSAYRTHGYKTRRMAIDNGIPLITDTKCAKLFIHALKATNGQRPPFNPAFDRISINTLIRLPGFIDVHCHVRQPGGEHKEDWRSCTRAAIAGGITMLLAMPNTQPPLVDNASFELVEELASSSAYCDYALYVGATPINKRWNESNVATLASKVAGLKMYLNETFSTLQMPSISDWMEHMNTFPRDRPVVCHAEKQTLASVLTCTHLTGRSVHICHVALAEEIQLIRAAKAQGMRVTCEVCPHHLFLTTDDLQDGWREVRPRLSNNADDCKALWDNMDIIDCFATDHAPHTEEEKSRGEKAPPGFPSIQYMVPLLLNAVNEKRLTLEQLIDRLYNNPRRIFGLPENKKTYIEVDMNEEWIIPADGGESKCHWTPYAGWRVRGKVRTVVIRGEEVFIDGRFINQPGFGKNVRLMTDGNANTDFDEFAAETEVEQLVDDTSVNAIALATKSRISYERSHSVTPPSLKLHSNVENFFYRRNILSVTDFKDKSVVNRLLDMANRFHNNSDVGGGLLKKYVLGLLFYEPSTRTHFSFESAMLRLDGKTMSLNVDASSVKKGESLEDTIQTMACYCDAIVLRHPTRDSCERAARVCKLPLINAGDGIGEHPTQALLDLYTIREELSTVNGKTIAMVGDLKNGRTVHSLAKILCLYHGITLHYVSPSEELGMPEEVRRYVADHSDFPQKTFNDLLEGIKGVDVVYMTRVQKERFANNADYERFKGNFILTPKILNQASKDNEPLETIRVNERPHQPTPIVMHPLPRVDEISAELDKDVRAVYMRQMQYGLYVRMALLALIFGAD